MDPICTHHDILQCKFELSLLVLVGLIYLEEGLPQLRRFVANDSRIPEIATMLRSVDDDTDPRELDAIVPRGQCIPDGSYDPTKASVVLALFSRFAQGIAITDEEVRACPDPFNVESLASQVHKRSLPAAPSHADEPRMKLAKAWGVAMGVGR